AGLEPTTNIFDPTLVVNDDGMPIGFQLGSTSVHVKDGEALTTYDVLVDSFRFRVSSPLTSIGPDPATPGNVLYSGILALKLSKAGGFSVAGGTSMKERTVGNLVVSVNPTTNAITGCYGTLNAQQACLNMGGIYNPGAAVKCRIPYPCEAAPNSIFLG